MIPVRGHRCGSGVQASRMWTEEREARARTVSSWAVSRRSGWAVSADSSSPRRSAGCLGVGTQDSYRFMGRAGTLGPAVQLPEREAVDRRCVQPAAEQCLRRVGHRGVDTGLRPHRRQQGDGPGRGDLGAFAAGGGRPVEAGRGVAEVARVVDEYRPQFGSGVLGLRPDGGGGGNHDGGSCRILDGLYGGRDTGLDRTVEDTGQGGSPGPPRARGDPRRGIRYSVPHGVRSARRSGSLDCGMPRCADGRSWRQPRSRRLPRPRKPIPPAGMPVPRASGSPYPSRKRSGPAAPAARRSTDPRTARTPRAAWPGCPARRREVPWERPPGGAWLPGCAMKLTPFGQEPWANSPASPVAARPGSSCPAETPATPISSPSGMPPGLLPGCGQVRRRGGRPIRRPGVGPSGHR